jgi:flavin reductase (DIM6/NTAB) family NADH-FMN oxidoreductase RutF
VTSFDPTELKRRDVTQTCAIVTPRPVAWVSSIGPDGISNSAPLSFFTRFDRAAYRRGRARNPLGVNKDTLRNIRSSGEFVCWLRQQRASDPGESVVGGICYALEPDQLHFREAR